MSNRSSLSVSLAIPIIQMGLIGGIVLASFTLPSTFTVTLQSIGELMCVLGMLVLGGGFVLLALIELGLSYSSRNRRSIVLQPATVSAVPAPQTYSSIRKDAPVRKNVKAPNAVLHEARLRSFS